MRHRLGNSPRCDECYFYRTNTDKSVPFVEGWGTEPYSLTHGVNGRKRETPLERLPVRSMWECTRWEDAEDRFTHFEIMTRSPEEWRADAEKEYIREVLNPCSKKT